MPVLLFSFNFIPCGTSRKKFFQTESGWQKLRENEGEIGYFLVKFGVELWGEISNQRKWRFAVRSFANFSRGEMDFCVSRLTRAGSGSIGSELITRAA